MQANKQLIEAAQTGTLRQKLSGATWGITPISDVKADLPYYSLSKDLILTPERTKFLKDQLARNTNKIINAGAVPILFDLPQSFNMKAPAAPAGGYVVRSELQIEKNNNILKLREPMPGYDVFVIALVVFMILNIIVDFVIAYTPRVYINSTPLLSI